MPPSPLSSPPSFCISPSPAHRFFRRRRFGRPLQMHYQWGGKPRSFRPPFIPVRILAGFGIRGFPCRRYHRDVTETRPPIRTRWMVHGTYGYDVVPARPNGKKNNGDDTGALHICTHPSVYIKNLPTVVSIHPCIPLPNHCDHWPIVFFSFGSFPS